MSEGLPQAGISPGTAAAVAPERIGLGIAYVLAAMTAMTIMDAAAKWLGAGYPITEVVFLRNFFAIPPIAILVWYGGGLASLRTRRLPSHALRAGLGLGAMFCFFTGLRYLPLAEAISIAFAAPLFVTALSVPILKEHVGPRRWAAVIAGFMGVLVITRPGGDVLRIEALLILAAALSYALFLLATRRLARSESTSAIIFYTNGIAIVVGALLLPFGWRTPTGEDLVIFVAMGLVGGCGSYFIAMAYRNAPAAVLAPFDYTTLLVGTALGWLIWHELPDSTVWLGAAVVVACGLYIIRRETR
ncbi:MAG: DMT family transporter [Alphaproteobacteria bacterium]